MRVAFIVGGVAIAGLSYGLWLYQRNSTCPTIERLRFANPVNDARQAVARGDGHLLMIGGFVGMVPKDDGSNRPRVLVAGTGDDVSEACRRLQSTAEAYATAYNAQVLERGR